MFASTVKFFLSWQKAENEQRSKLQCATFIELLWSHKTCISDRFQCFNTWRPHSPQMWWTVYEAIPLGLPKWALELFGWQQQPLQSSLSNDCLTGLAESSLDFRLCVHILLSNVMNSRSCIPKESNNIGWWVPGTKCFKYTTLQLYSILELTNLTFLRFCTFIQSLGLSEHQQSFTAKVKCIGKSKLNFVWI